MNPYMELPKLKLPARVATPNNASIDPGISALAYRAVIAAEEFGNTVRRFVEARRQRREIRRAVAELSALNDRTLKDIGIDRSEIRSVVEEVHRTEASGDSAPASRVERFASVRPIQPDAANDNSQAAEAA